MVDQVGTAALAVSFVAFIVAILQVTQQYAATAYDYRRCSRKTIGAWARNTKRKWIWSEVRFEITFSAPRITLRPRPTPYTAKFTVLKEDTYSDGLVPTSDQSRSEKFQPDGLPSSTLPGYDPPNLNLIIDATDDNHQYCFIPYSLASQIGEYYNAKDKPWFLHSTGSIPEARCSWLNLLQYTTLTDVSFTITERRSSYDYIPEGATRPLASMDQKSFLTLMSLFRISWRGRGVDGVFSGASDIAEVSTRDIMNFGRTYYFNSRDTSDSNRLLINARARGTKYYIPSERARAAMFNSFDLGFATAQTHTYLEVISSLKAAGLGGETAEFVGAFYKANNRWSPGLAEAIVSWAYPSMPKAIDEERDDFKSVFSAMPTMASLGNPIVVFMLCPASSLALSTCQNPASTAPPATAAATATPQSPIRSWAQDYLHERPSFSSLVLPHLRWLAAQPPSSKNVVYLRIPWSRALPCLDGIVALDTDLETNLLQGLDTQERLRLKSMMFRFQIRYQCRAFKEASAAADETATWRDRLDLIAARNGIKLVADIQKHFDGDARKAQHVLMNRWMRGCLWTIHNANCPAQNIRELECSLSSEWLLDSSTVYIA
ncbi:hypothetical protein SISNIDRAFT_486244 [Sistotremastrum niveocremeum HHB9708]|uniref:Uncharacterized protein n=1 Tax=Sistotremastrum niveocremeum HHB9708 TaxID=1314777 RepID=A0A164TXV4_9AGAM|nr:hypothetical protein SISNIDRAFT_486244 [Sistotremastrum niveocremeum HHB9708]